MKKLFSFVFVYLFFVISSVFTAQSGSVFSHLQTPYKTLKFKTVYDGWGEKSKAKMYYNGFISGEKIRTEWTDENGEPFTVSIVKDNWIYQRFAGKKTGWKIKLTDMNAQLQIFAPVVNSQETKKGTEKICGQECGIYESITTNTVLFTQTTYKTTRWKNKDGFIMKHVMEEVGASSDTKPSVYEVTYFEKNPRLEASLFEPANDIEYADMSDPLKAVFGGSGNSRTAQADTSAAEENTEDDEKTESTASSELINSTADEAGKILNSLFGN